MQPPDPALAETTPDEGAVRETGAPPPQILGRYALRELLGAGGMGEVWAAHDPSLDRTVAIKLVRAELASPRTRARLGREAQALARVNHPNVVTIYEVATAGDQVYFVQELVRGVDLARWLTAALRTWHEITGVFVQAGRGLAAAHDADIIHRDFKPSNVLVGDDGRVRVGDFGLARTNRGDDDDGQLAEGSPPPASDKLTATGAILGTPLYMSPEQHLGHAPTAAGDQFSFCVSLYQALYGQLPFAGKTALDYSIEAVRGSVQAVPANTLVPAWVHALVLRGLRADGRAPYESMHALVDALAAEPPRKRRPRWLLGGTALGVVVAGTIAVASVSAREAPCTGAPGELASVWNFGTKVAARAAFTSTGLPYAPDAWQRVEATLDRYGDAWSAMHTDTCKATRVRGEQSEAVLDLRMSCLRHRLQDLGAAVALFAKADAQTVEKAASVAALPPVAECGDVDALQAVTPLPRDPIVAARVVGLRARLAEEHALYGAGKYKEALPLATAIVADARPVGYPPVLADALLALGGVQRQLELDAAPTLREAYVQAQASGLDKNAALAAGAYAEVLGGTKTHRDEAMWWVDIARGTLKRRPDRSSELFVAGSVARVLVEAGRYEQARAELDRAIALQPDAAAEELHMLAVVLERQGKHQDALAAARKALEQEQRVLGPDHPTVADEQAEIASLWGQLGHLDEALAEARVALATEEHALGSDHPLAAALRFNIAMFLSEQGKYAEALVEYRRVLGMQQRWLPADEPAVADTYSRIGMMLGYLGKFDEAIAAHQAALSIDTRTMDADDPKLGEVHLELGMTYNAANRLDDALRELRAALDIFERRLSEHPSTAKALSEMASVLQEQGKFEPALAAARRALAIRLKVLGPDGLEIGDSHKVIADVLESSGKNEQALAEYNLALGLLEKRLGLTPYVLGVHANMALALGNLGRHREQATELSLALAGLEKTMGPHDVGTATARADLGSALLAAGDYARAVDQLAVAADDLAKGSDPGLLAATRFELARARWGLGNDRPQARSLAVQAAAELARSTEPVAVAELADAKKWLASH